MELFIPLEDPPTIPFIPLSALSEGFSGYDCETETKSVEILSNENSVRNCYNIQPHLYEYRLPQKLLENKSVIHNSILIDEEKKNKKKNENDFQKNKKVCFSDSPKESRHRRTKSETKSSQKTYKLEIIDSENKFHLRQERIKEEVKNQFFF
jgi:hypothetical protein